MDENMKNPEEMDDLENLEDMDEEDDDLIAFETEDGEEVLFRVEEYFFYNGDEYAVLSEYTEDEDEEEDEEGVACIVCKIEPTTDENGEESEEFINIEDEELAAKLIEIANLRLKQDEEVDE